MWLHQMSPRVACSTLVLGFFDEGDDDYWDSCDPPDLKQFIAQFREAIKEGESDSSDFDLIRRGLPSSNTHFAGCSWDDYGAVYAQTTKDQKTTIKHLTTVGFKPVLKFYNKKNGTWVQSWMISMKDLQKFLTDFDAGTTKED